MAAALAERVWRCGDCPRANPAVVTLAAALACAPSTNRRDGLREAPECLWPGVGATAHARWVADALSGEGRPAQHLHGDQSFTGQAGLRHCRFVRLDLSASCTKR